SCSSMKALSAFIVGNWNGDEGFSAHENTEAYVRGGEFSNNYWHGINDIIYSRTHFVDVVCRDNRSKGVRFNGGMHSLTDCEVSGSPINVELLPYPRANFPLAAQHPLAESLTNIRNTVIRSADDEIGVFVGPDSEAVIEHSLLEGGAPVIDVQSKGTAFVVNSVVMGGEEAEVVAAGEYLGDHNLYHPGRFTIADAEYDADAFAEYRSATGNDGNSLIGEPVLAEDGAHLAAGSPGYREAESGAYGGYAMGPQDRTQASASTGAGPVLRGTLQDSRMIFDFEEENAWSRTYPEPSEIRGTEVPASSELSTEQARSGATSAKVSMSAPEEAAEAIALKLFTEDIDTGGPVSAWSAWVYSEEALRFDLRIRDIRGESFYGPAIVHEGAGWQELSWDLSETPPGRIAGGNENQAQDAPLEFVLTTSIRPQDGQTELVYYVDDLELRLAD
ncbi:MAG: hypothetical protein ACLFU7_12110, partial [Armatimonadota bacterium]